MRTLILVSCLVVPTLALTGDPPKGEPARGVEINYHGQSFFTLRSSKGTIVAFDPHAIDTYGRVLGLKADVVLMSHDHNDHTQIGAFDDDGKKVKKIIKGLKGAGNRSEWNTVDEKFNDVHIRSVGTYHDTMQGLQRGKNTVFIVEVDGWKIVHLGDLGHELTKQQLKEIGEVDVLMVPVGGIYTLNGSEAKKVVAQIKPKEYILPMHYGTPVFDELLKVDEFLDEQEARLVAVSKDNRLSLNRDAQRPRPLIAVLHYWPSGKKKD